MTLAIGLVGTDFIVLGADRQQTNLYLSGTTSTEMVNKIEQINKRAAFMLAGEETGRPPFRVALRTIMREKEDDLLDDETNLINLGNETQNIFLEQERDFLSTPVILPKYQFLIAGLDTRGEPKMYSLTRPIFRPQTRETYWPIGANGQAVYFLSRCYRRELTQHQMALLCYFCISQTDDPSVGGGADIAIINREEGFHYIATNPLAEQSEEISRLIQRQFQE